MHEEISEPVAPLRMVSGECKVKEEPSTWIPVVDSVSLNQAQVRRKEEWCAYHHR
jgi:hypothetical protein